MGWIKGDGSYNVIMGFLLAVVLFYVAIKVLKIPKRAIKKFLANSVIGTLLLIAFNFLGQIFHFYIGVNFFTIFVTGIAGIPGFIALVIIRLIV